MQLYNALVTFQRQFIGVVFCLYFREHVFVLPFFENISELPRFYKSAVCFYLLREIPPLYLHIVLAMLGIYLHNTLYFTMLFTNKTNNNLQKTTRDKYYQLIHYQICLLKKKPYYKKVQRYLLR